MKRLTLRQQEILSFISQSIKNRGYPPTIREIGHAMGIHSTNGVNDHLKALERKGYLCRDGLKSRAMRPTTPEERAALIVAGAASGDIDDELVAQAARFGQPQAENELPGAFEAQAQSDWISVPVLGRVAAGEPILAIEDAEDTVQMDRVLIGNAVEVFALRIVGQSMIEAGIYDGDFVFVKKTPTADPGSIVIAYIDGSATCKRYFPEPELGRIRFQPENSTMVPIYVRQEDFSQTMILGQVIGSYRRYI